VLVAVAGTSDLKQIDTEMQAILAELLMPCPQPPSPVVHPSLARPLFPVSPENAVASNLVDGSQPQILSEQLLQAPAPGMLCFTATECSKQQSVFILIFYFFYFWS